MIATLGTKTNRFVRTCLPQQVPDLTMLPMGPFYDLTVRRSQLPSPDMWKAAVQKDKRCAFF